MIYTDGVHLIAGNLQELHIFAKSVGLKRQWFQEHHKHYDITTARMLKKVLGTGKVIKVSTREVLKRRKRWETQ